MSKHFKSAVLAVFIAAMTVGKNSVDGASCISKKIPLTIMRAEELVQDTIKPRFYRVCSGTTITIRDYDWETDTFSGPGQDTLSIWNPNVNIICADTGRVGSIDNNCVFKGGTFHVEILPAVVLGINATASALENISIQGFKFTEASEANIFIYGTNEPAAISNDDNVYSASVTVSDCMFFKNTAYTMIWLLDYTDTFLEVKGSTFEDNTLIESKYAQHTGIITSTVGGTIRVTDTEFLDNKLEAVELKSAMRAIIYAVQDTNNGWHTNLDVSDSTFIGNSGMTFALVVGGLWDEEGAVLTSSNNFQRGNSMSYARNNECYGVAHLIQDVAFLGDKYYYYYDHRDAICDATFETTVAPTAAPSAAPTYSQAPSVTPAMPTSPLSGCLLPVKNVLFICECVAMIALIYF